MHAMNLLDTPWPGVHPQHQHHNHQYESICIDTGIFKTTTAWPWSQQELYARHSSYSVTKLDDSSASLSSRPWSCPMPPPTLYFPGGPPSSGYH